MVSASGTTKEDYRSTTISVSTNTSLSGAIVDPTESSKKGITVNFYFVGEEGEGNYKIPDYADGFLGGYYTNGTYNSDGTWTTPDEESTKLTENTSGDTTYYSITLSKLYAGDVTFQIYLEYKLEETGSEFTDWYHQMDDISYTVSKYLANGGTIDVTVYQDPNDFIIEDSDTLNVHIGLKNSGNQGNSNSFYIMAGHPWSNDHTTSSEGYTLWYEDSGTEMTANADLSAVVSADVWYTASDWSKSDEFLFTLCTNPASGSYWSTTILPSPDISKDSNDYCFWTYYAESDGDRNAGFEFQECRSTTLLGVNDLYLVFTFSFASSGAVSNMTYTITAM